MRTPQQIENLRFVMMLSYGPFAIFMPDEVVNKWADRVQEEIDCLDTKEHVWTLRVKSYEDAQKDWNDIEPEPKKVVATAKNLFASCRGLMEKYPQIHSIQIRGTDNFPREITRV